MGYDSRDHAGSGGRQEPGREAEGGGAAPGSLRGRILGQWNGLSVSERKLASLLMQPGFSMAGFQAAELAAMAGVSRACTARFFQKLGYEGFQQARRQARDQDGNSPLDRTAAAMGCGLGNTPGPNPEPAWGSYIAAEQEQLGLLQQSLQPGQLTQAVEYLFRAPRVFVLGLRASHVLACYAQALWLQLRQDVFVLGDAAGRPSELLSQLRPGDLLVVVDFRRRASQLLPLMEAAGRRRVSQLLITDTAMSDLVPRAALTLCCPNARRHVFDSHLAAFALLHFLAVEMASAYPAEVRGRLRDIEDLHRQLGDLA